MILTKKCSNSHFTLISFVISSQHLLSIDKSKVDEFIKKHAGSELIKNSVITCAAILKRNSPEQNAVACPVIGTEAGHIYILDPQAFTIVHQVELQKKIFVF